MVDSLRLADGNALQTLAAEAAVQTAFSFLYRFFFGKRTDYLIEAGKPFLQIYVLRAQPGFPLVFALGQRCWLFIFLFTALTEVKPIQVAAPK